MTDLHKAAQQALEAIRNAETFDHLETVTAPMLEAALAAPAVPPGYALVPVEPTPEMLRAYTGGAITEAGFKWCRHQWAAMLAAAPQPKDKP